MMAAAEREPPGKLPASSQDLLALPNREDDVISMKRSLKGTEGHRLRGPRGKVAQNIDMKEFLFKRYLVGKSRKYPEKVNHREKQNLSKKVKKENTHTTAHFTFNGSL